jgi:vancomycin permeability regulator SanA
MRKNLLINNLDKDTKYAKLTLAPKIYTLQSIFAAGYVFLDKAYILLDQDRNKNIEVYLFSKDSQNNLKALGLEFYNELLNYSHYFSRVENNSSLIKTIMQRVLFSVNPKFAEEAEEQEIQELLKELDKEEPIKRKSVHGLATPKKKK